MKIMKQFEDATLELVLFGFDVLTTSGEDKTYEGDDTDDVMNVNF